MNVLVTGGAGFIGSHIVDSLVEAGHYVSVVDNLSTGDLANVNSKATFYQADILDSELDRIVEKEAPEVIIHLAAMVYVQQSIVNPLSDGMVNVIGTLNVLRSAKSHGIRKVIYSSTCAVYGEAPSKIANEDSIVSPISFYGASKYMAEIYVKLFSQLYQLDYTIFRYANVYGPRQKHHGEGGVIPKFVENIRNKVTPMIFGDGNQTRDFIHVKDVAKAALLALDKGSHRTLNIGTGIGTSINELYRSIQVEMGSKIDPIYMPERIGDVKHIILDPSRSKQELGWTINHNFQTALKETIDLNRCLEAMKQSERQEK